MKLVTAEGSGRGPTAHLCDSLELSYASLRLLATRLLDASKHHSRSCPGPQRVQRWRLSEISNRATVAGLHCKPAHTCWLKRGRP
jgi:hypothetical protein